MEQKQREKILNNIDILVSGTKNLDSLLRRLVSKGVFNKVMEKKIRGHGSEEEQKREMYVMITKRGPKAFNNLYCALWEENLKELAKLLRERLFQEANATDEPDLTFLHHHPLIPSQRRLDLNLERAYAMGSRPKGYVLLMNYNEYENNLFSERSYSEADETLLKNLWNDLGYEVEFHRDLDHKTSWEIFETFSKKEELKNADSIIIYIMSSVEREAGYMVDTTHIFPKNGFSIIVKSIIDLFSGRKCKYGLGKPKIFFFQTFGCEKNNNLPDITCDSSVNFSPDIADTLVINYSFIDSPHFEQDSGSFFTKEMCNVFRRNAHQYDIITMLKEISQNLSNVYHEVDGHPTLKWNNYGFDKKLFFNPGLYNY